MPLLNYTISATSTNPLERALFQAKEAERHAKPENLSQMRLLRIKAQADLVNSIGGDHFGTKITYTSTTAPPKFSTKPTRTIAKPPMWANSHTIAPQFSAPTTTQRKKSSFKNKIILGTMLCLGINFSDQINQTVDKLMGKQPTKIHGISLASFGTATNVSADNTNYTITPDNKTNLAPPIEIFDETTIAKPNNISTDLINNNPAELNLGSVNTANEQLKDFKSYYEHFMASPHVVGFNATPEKILTLANIVNNESPEKGYAELPTDRNGGGASGAYQFMCTTWQNMGILQKVGETLKTKPSKAHLVCAALNQQAAENNEPYLYIPFVNKQAHSTGKYCKLELTDEAREVSGLINATDIYTTEAGARLQDYAATKLMQNNEYYIPNKDKKNVIELAKEHANLWYYGPNHIGKKPPYGRFHLFSQQVDVLNAFKQYAAPMYADTLSTTSTIQSGPL